MSAAHDVAPAPLQLESHAPQVIGEGEVVAPQTRPRYHRSDRHNGSQEPFLGSAEPLPRWLLAVAVLGAAGAGGFLWAEGFDRRMSGFWAAWRLAGGAAVLLLPVVLFREAVKRGWFYSSGREH